MHWPLAQNSWRADSEGAGRKAYVLADLTHLALTSSDGQWLAKKAIPLRGDISAKCELFYRWSEASNCKTGKPVLQQNRPRPSPSHPSRQPGSSQLSELSQPSKCLQLRAQPSARPKARLLLMKQRRLQVPGPSALGSCEDRCFRRGPRHLVRSSSTGLQMRRGHTDLAEGGKSWHECTYAVNTGARTPPVAVCGVALVAHLMRRGGDWTGLGATRQYVFLRRGVFGGAHATCSQVENCRRWCWRRGCRPTRQRPQDVGPKQKRGLAMEFAVAD